MENLGNGFDYALLNNIFYTMPEVPTLFSVLSSGDLATNSEIYDEFAYPFIPNYSGVVHVVLNNGDTGSHLFHLHGHDLQDVDQAPSYGPTFYDCLNGNPVRLCHTIQRTMPHSLPSQPAEMYSCYTPRYFVIRFVADNPGV
jgi:iron transport multicopper oxidase